MWKIFYQRAQRISFHKKQEDFLIDFPSQWIFLQKDPLEWENDNSFQIGLEIIKKLFVNDTAERELMKLMEDYNKILSRSEEEKQYILQIVSEKIPRQYEINIGSGFVKLGK